MAIWTSHGLGRAAPDEADVTMAPSAYALDGTLRGTVYCHPAGGSALSGSDPFERFGEWALVRGLAEAGPLVVTDLGGPSTYGNDESVARVEDARGLLARVGAAPGPISLVASSMGAVTALRYAAAHRELVSAVVLVLPLIDLVAAWDGDVGGEGLAIAQAWHVSWLLRQPLPDGASPLDHVAELQGLRLQCWTASDDAYLPAATTAAFVDQLGAPAEVRDLGALGHTEAAIASVPVAEVLAFLGGPAAAVQAVA